MAGEALRDVLLQVSGDYARLRIAERENARIRSERLADRDSEREYAKSLREEERQYADRLRKQVTKEQLEFIEAQARAIAEAGLANAPLVAAAQWKQRAAAQSLPFDENGEWGPQTKAIIEAEAEQFKANEIMKVMAQQEAQLSAGEALLGRSQALRDASNKPAIESGQQNIAALRQELATVMADADAQVRAIVDPINREYALAVARAEGLDPMSRQTELAQAEQIYKQKTAVAKDQIELITRAAQGRAASINQIISGLSQGVSNMGAMITPPVAPADSPIIQRFNNNPSMSSPRGAFSSGFFQPEIAPDPMPAVAQNPVGSAGARSIPPNTSYLNPPPPAPAAPAPTASTRPPITFWDGQRPFAYRDNPGYLPVVDDAITLGGNAVIQGARNLGRWIADDWKTLEVLPQRPPAGR